MSVISVAPATRSAFSRIVSVVASREGVLTEQLLAPSRGRARIARARQVAMYLCHVGVGQSMTDVGRFFGRDRTTVAHACQLVEDRRDDPAFDDALDELESLSRADAATAQ